MAAFKTILDDVGHALEVAFTNKTAEDIEQGGLAIAELAFPAVSPLLVAIGKSVATAQGLAANVPAGLTTAQMTALVISDAQQAFQTYQAATGTVIETAQQQGIIALFIQILQNIPAAKPATPATPVAAAPSVQTQAATGTLL